jgi:nucleotide-binding universal stress UspA family protein
MVVIAGVDGGERSRDAIVLAQRIAPVVEAELVAVYVYPIDEVAGYLTGGSLPEVRRLIDDAANVAHARVRELASEMGVDEVRLRTASSAAAGLHACAVEEDTQLVVLGSSGRSGLDRVFPGSTAARLLSGSPVAVAVAPAGYADQQTDSRPVGADTTVRRRRVRLSSGQPISLDGVIVGSACSPFSAGSPSVMWE